MKAPPTNEHYPRRTDSAGGMAIERDQESFSHHSSARRENRGVGKLGGAGKRRTEKTKKLKRCPQLKTSQLERSATGQKTEKKSPGSANRSKKAIVEIDEERIVEPAQVPLGAKFNKAALTIVR